MNIFSSTQTFRLTRRLALLLNLASHQVLLVFQRQVLPTLGGQTALNLAMELFARGKVGVPGTPELIGANAEAIATAEDRGKFKEAMIEIGLSVPRPPKM